MKEGPQPPACVVDSCERPPANGLVGYCAAHRDHYADGSATTPPIIQPDDPALLEREAKKAAEAEAKEYAERRRVKTWKTLENGSRVPEEYWTDEELEAMEAHAEALVMSVRTRGVDLPVSKELIHESRAMAELMARDREREAVDPVKEATKAFKRALRGRYGPAAEKLAWALAETLGEDLLP